MSKTVRYKLSAEEFRIVLDAANGLGVSVEVLAKNSLAYVLRQARELHAKAKTEAEAATPADSTEAPVSDTVVE